LKIAVTAHIITSREGEYPLRLSRHHDPQGSGEAARTCRGVWLDRGELDKLIERSGSSKPQVKRDYDDDDDDDFRLGRWSKTPGKKKKSSFLGEMFDF
jgi:Zn-finger nucleic acid-binding protein